VKLRMTRLIIIPLILLLTACGAGQSGAASPSVAQAPASALPTANAAVAATPAPTTAAARGISATGEVKAAQDASLSFAVQGTVDQVLVKAGDVVTKGQTLAILDTRSFDQKIEQAQAALDIAQASEAALTEKPKAADLSAAQAQVRQAQIALEQSKVNQTQNTRSAESALAQTQANLQSQRDKLSQAKTSAEAQVQQAALALTKAQSAYSTALQNWQHVQDEDTDPTNPSTTDASGKKKPNKLNDAQRQVYYAAYVQAEAALHQAEQTLQQAQVDAEQARQAEVTGIQQAEQQVTQAQANLDKMNLPANADSVAASQATLDQARANQAKLNPAPGESDKAKASASVRQAQVSLDAAKLDREHAELHAPFDGVAAEVNIDPGDPSSTSGQVPIRVIDISTLHVDADVSDVDIGRISVGQAAQLTADVGTNKVYTGKVSYIAPSATASGNVRTYQVRIALDDQAGLRPGMRVRVMFTA
jgi:HlyD family secretion protein